MRKWGGWALRTLIGVGFCRSYRGDCRRKGRGCGQENRTDASAQTGLNRMPSPVSKIGREYWTGPRVPSPCYILRHGTSCGEKQADNHRSTPQPGGEGGKKRCSQEKRAFFAKEVHDQRGVGGRLTRQRKGNGVRPNTFVTRLRPPTATPSPQR